MVVRFYRYIFLVLVLSAAVVWIAASELPDPNLHIIACDVGQGDAILTTYKNIQILTDGGPGRKVLDCLNRYVPFWDREIELVVSTHPDADHASGLVDVIERYDVGTILINSVDPGTQVYKALKNAVGSRGVRVVNPDEGMKLRIGLIYLDVLRPSAEFESEETNDYSIVYRLEYGDFEAILPGDIDSEISEQLPISYLVSSVEYIKIPHHGSRNGITENLLKALMPKIAVISVGKNSYGHPHKEILDLLSKYEVKTFRTDEMGDIEVVTDGKEFWVEK